MTIELLEGEPRPQLQLNAPLLYLNQRHFSVGQAKTDGLNPRFRILPGTRCDIAELRYRLSMGTPPLVVSGPLFPYFINCQYLLFPDSSYNFLNCALILVEGSAVPINKLKGRVILSSLNWTAFMYYSLLSLPRFFGDIASESKDRRVPCLPLPIIKANT